ncbi:MAG: trimeric autotransporter adhesin [Actinomycetota bacterium]|jgi:CSLREA domain-containing protein|nr:trimeric autotransporter adhesin [Actinomycetota bacterium]
MGALVLLGFLPAVSSRAATVITVNTATDSDAECTVDECSLREAIELSNQLAGKDTIAFSIPGTPPPAIQPVASFPTIIDPVAIDGTTQPGYNGAPLVEIDGSLLNNPGAYGEGLTLWASDSLIRGLVIHGFEGGSALTIQADRLIDGSGGDNNVVQNNYLGTSRDGLHADQNFFGLILNKTQGNLIGGASPSEANIISGNYEGINISPGSGAGTRIIGNKLGTDPTGTIPVGNTGQAIRLDGSDYTIGGAGTGEGNIMSGNAGDGFEIVSPSASGNVIQGNRIGIGSDGRNLGNLGGAGVVFAGEAHDNLIGGTLPGEGNVIANNGYGGIYTYDGVGNSFLGNSIYNNQQPGIDLLVSSSGGPTPNDANDADQGANNLQNFPVLLSGEVVGSSASITARLRSTPNSVFRVEFFDNGTCDPTGFGEGRYPIGATSVTTSDVGEVTFDFGAPVPALTAHQFTATATDAAGNTSEFSRCLKAGQTGTEPTPTPGSTVSPSPTPSGSPGPTTPPPPDSADVSVTQSVHHAGRFFPDPGPLLEGPPEIPDELWIVYEISNDGPAGTDVTFRVHADTFDYRRPGAPGYDFWTVPMRNTGSTHDGGSNACNRKLVCRFRLRAGSSFTYILDAEANAPGPFSIYGTANGEAPDPDGSNNKSALFDRRVTCSITGTPQADRLTATAEPDSICGGAGDDRLIAVGKLDKIFGQAGNDVLSGKPGNNQSFLGGDGFDIATFKDASGPVSISLHVRTAGGRSAYEIEGAVGSRFGDYITGLLGADKLWGGPGNDRIAGRSGSDQAWGGGGDDRFITVDDSIDDVDGGSGNDITQSDSGDHVRSASRSSSPTFYLDPV